VVAIEQSAKIYPWDGVTAAMRHGVLFFGAHSCPKYRVLGEKQTSTPPLAKDWTQTTTLVHCTHHQPATCTQEMFSQSHHGKSAFRIFLQDTQSLDC
jgi:hypothetical protein